MKGDRQRRSLRGWLNNRAEKLASAFSTTRASHAAVPKRQDAPDIQLSSRSGPQPFIQERHLGAREIYKQRHSAALGEWRGADGLMLARNSVLSRQTGAACNRSRFGLTRLSDYSEFRGWLGQSSGFQSWQYRAIEFLAGNRNLAMLTPHDHRPEIVADLTAILAEPSLYQEAILLLSRRGLDVGEAAQES